ncbi:MAG: M56 family metallopeptidase [Bacteroidota bacterium]
MNEILNYLIESSLLLLVFWSFYHFFLKGTGSLQLNRGYLLLSLVLAFGLPMLHIPLMEVGAGEMVGQFTLETVLISPQSPSLILRPDLWLVVYLIGTGLSAILLLSRLARILSLISRSDKDSMGDMTIVHIQEDFPVASFFHYLLWPQETGEKLHPQIVEHESCHARQRHSWDILFLEALKVVFWFQPMLWLYQREVQTNHEFLADAEASQKIGSLAYGQLLLQQHLSDSLPLVQAFSQSSMIKARLEQLKAGYKSQGLQWKHGLILPLIAGMFFLVSCEWQEEPTLSEPDPLAVIEIENPPQPSNMMEIRRSIGYPKAAREAGIEGQVVMRILVGEKGEYIRHEEVTSYIEHLSEAVEAQLPQLSFEPATLDGKPKKFWVNIPFAFKLLK